MTRLLTTFLILAMMAWMGGTWRDISIEYMDEIAESENVHSGNDKDGDLKNKRTIFANPDNEKNALQYAALRRKLKSLLTMLQYNNQNQERILETNNLKI